ncbi:MAG: YfhO family protein [Bryobacterales bacterium]|nr:YfhO family protein [Bryobacterales bacterium]
MRNRAAVSWILDAALAFTFAAILIWPLFRLEYSDKWASIEATFISDARFLRDHWPHPRWQPLWYTGTRFDYIYPPALRYGTAVQTKISPGTSPARAYHQYVALLYCLGIAGVYVLARTGGRSRAFSLLAAFTVATISPSFLFFPEIRADAKASWSEPQRLGVLHRYGEGPHMSALALLGFALAFSIQALRQGTRGWLAAAALTCALVVSHNFYGATALAMFFPILLWSWWITHQDWRMFYRAVFIAVLSYGLTAFWLVPSYVHVTLENMRFVSERGNRWSMWVLIVLVIGYMKATEAWAKGRKERAWVVFLIGSSIIFTLNVVGNRYLQFRVIGEPGRMMPELDLVYLLAACELLRWLWHAEWPRLPVPPIYWRVARQLVVVLIVAKAFYSVKRYTTGSWNIFVDGGDPKQRVEYRITEWLAKNRPHARSYTTGSVRFWFNAWFDLAELGGGSEQGLLNPVVQPATWQLAGSDSGDSGILWLQCTGTDLAIIHDKRSKEEYHDVTYPEKFVGKMPAIYDDGEGNFIYEVPRRYRSLARVIDRASLDAMSPMPEDPPEFQLRMLADVLEKGPEAPTQTQWLGTEHLRIKATTKKGQSLFVWVPYNQPWQAREGDARYKPSRTQLNFMRLDVPPGDHTIDLVFRQPVENTVGWVLTLGTLGILSLLVARPRRVI